MHSYQEPKSPRESHPSARRQEPRTGAGQANGPALLRFGWTIFDNGHPLGREDSRSHSVTPCVRLGGSRRTGPKEIRGTRNENALRAVLRPGGRLDAQCATRSTRSWLGAMVIPVPFFPCLGEAYRSSYLWIPTGENEQASQSLILYDDYHTCV